MRESESTEPPSKHIGAIILAAGQGTRMRSALPKVLHPAAGRPMLLHVLSLASALDCRPIAVVLGHQADEVRRVLPESCAVAVQLEQLGTGHAVAQARSALQGQADRVLVLYGDAPLCSLDTLRRLVQASERAPLALLTAELDDPTGYGRILRGPDGRVRGIVEERETDAASSAIREINSGVLCAAADWLWTRLERLEPHHGGEFYLTDLVQLAANEGLAIGTVQPGSADEVLGVNDRLQLAAANRVLWERKRVELMRAGVTILDPATTFIDADVQVGQDTVLHPGTHLRGRTVVGRGCELGPNAILDDARLGDECRVLMSVVEGSELGARVLVGPFAHVRPGARVEAEVELGNFSEIKASLVGAGSKIHHFSYIGDAELGRGVNVGAGTITCNFDGQAKHRTVIGDGAFIGSDTMLVAPISVGKQARTGAGSVVTRDVPAGQLVVGIPARQVPAKPNPPRENSSGGSD